MNRLFRRVIILAAAISALALTYNSFGGIDPFGARPVLGDAARSEGLPRQEGVHLIGHPAAVRFYNQQAGPILDARSPASYREGHIRGALNCFVYELEDFLPRILPRLSPDQPLMVYCAGEDCEDSRFLAESLREMGFSRIFVYEGGFERWIAETMPVAEGAPPGENDEQEGAGGTLSRLADFSAWLPGWFWKPAEFALLATGLLVLVLVIRGRADSLPAGIAVRVVGVVFIAASIHKILTPAQFASIIDNYEILPGELVNLPAVLLPWMELVCGVLLAAGVWRRSAAVIIAGLTGMFIAAISFNMVRGLDFDCGCFGSGHVPPWRVLIRDIGLLLMILPGVVRE